MAGSVTDRFAADRPARPRLTGLAGGTACLTTCVALRQWPKTITFRADEDALRALSILTQDGTPVSTAVRSALIDAARARAHQRLRAEAEALASDEGDRAEAAQVLRDMETLRAW